MKAECSSSCRRHPGGHCALPAPLTVDLFVACAPCNPYSVARAERQVSHPTLHKEYDVLFGDSGSVVATLKLVLPFRWVSESVEGFGQAYSPTDCNTGLADLENSIFEIRRPDGEQHFVGFGVLQVKGQMWINVRRVRF